MEIEISESPDEADYKHLYDALDAFNDAASGIPDPARKLALLVRGPAGTPIGGLWAVSYWSWMFVQLLYLAPALRRSGLGSRLLAQAETIARRDGCIGIWLDTFSFQARPFYERHGFHEFGRIPDYPPGAARHFMAKRLGGGKAGKQESITTEAVRR
jgi:GNAT superfamily N-acetyltransferase